jgi:hypothetical protein
MPFRGPSPAPQPPELPDGLDVPPDRETPGWGAGRYRQFENKEGLPDPAPLVEKSPFKGR